MFCNEGVCSSFFLIVFNFRECYGNQMGAE